MNNVVVSTNEYDINKDLLTIAKLKSEWGVTQTANIASY